MHEKAVQRVHPWCKLGVPKQMIIRTRSNRRQKRTAWHVFIYFKAYR